MLNIKEIKIKFIEFFSAVENCVFSLDEEYIIMLKNSFK